MMFLYVNKTNNSNLIEEKHIVMSIEIITFCTFSLFGGMFIIINFLFCNKINNISKRLIFYIGIANILRSLSGSILF
jgi:hypothetical protein